MRYCDHTAYLPHPPTPLAPAPTLRATTRPKPLCFRLSVGYGIEDLVSNPVRPIRAVNLV